MGADQSGPGATAFRFLTALHKDDMAGAYALLSDKSKETFDPDVLKGTEGEARKAVKKMLMGTPTPIKGKSWPEVVRMSKPEYFAALMRQAGKVPPPDEVVKEEQRGPRARVALKQGKNTMDYKLVHEAGGWRIDLVSVEE